MTLVMAGVILLIGWNMVSIFQKYGSEAEQTADEVHEISPHAYLPPQLPEEEQ